MCAVSWTEICKQKQPTKSSMLLESWALFIIHFCNTLAFPNQQNLIIVCPCWVGGDQTKEIWDEHMLLDAGTLLLPNSYYILAFHFTKKDIKKTIDPRRRIGYIKQPKSGNSPLPAKKDMRTFQCARVSSFGQMSQRLRSCFRRVQPLDSLSSTTHSSLRNIKNTLLANYVVWECQTFEKGSRDSAYVPSSSSSSFTTHSSSRITKRTTGWTYVQLAGTNRTALSTIQCCHFLGPANFGLPSCKTLIFDSPTFQNKTTCLDVCVWALSWAKAWYKVYMLPKSRSFQCSQPFLLPLRSFTKDWLSSVHVRVGWGLNATSSSTCFWAVEFTLSPLFCDFQYSNRQ